MPIEEGALMAAVDAGIAQAGAAPAPASEPTPTENADVPENQAGTDDGADGAGETGAEAGVEGGADAGAGDAPPADDAAAGAPVPGAGVKPVVDADGKPVAPAPVVPEVKAPDPLNDPLPNALKRETKVRITTLVGMVKEKDQAFQRVDAEHRELVGAILETKANPEQYRQALDYLRMVNSPSRADQEQALRFMQQEVAVMARRLGVPVPGVNMLEGHDDLIAEVSTGRLSPERAQEIAAARAAAHEAQRMGQRQQENDAITRRNLEAINKGKADLGALGRQLAATEPQVYEAKRKVLVVALKPVFDTIPPNQWAATFKRAYDALPAPAAPPVSLTPPALRTGAPAGGGGNTPLRASNPAGGAAPAPKSLAEAIDFGIAQAGG